MAMQDAAPWPSQVRPAPPSRKRGWWPYVLAGLLAGGLVIGLLVWAPWQEVPVPPGAVHVQSPTATSVRVSWSASQGGSAIDHYLVLRDGASVAEVPASQTSYVDNGLVPGTAHRYTIVAESGTQQSSPSVKAAVTTITPSPIGMPVTQQTWTTAVLHWSPSPNGPVPGSYVLYRGNTLVAVIPGTTDSYSLTGLTPGSVNQYQVTAKWGDHESGRSSVLPVATLAVPLQGSSSVQVKTTSTPGGNSSLKVGQKWNDSWTFTSTCAADRCTMTTNGAFSAPGFAVTSFTINMTSSGSGYAGSTRAQITKCGSINVNNTVTLHIAPASGAVHNGAWNSWNGTMQLSSPYVTASSTTFCPAQSWNFSITGTGA